LIARANEIKDVIEGSLGPVTRGTATTSLEHEGAKVGEVAPLPPAAAAGGAKLVSTRQRSQRDHDERIESVESVMVDAGRCNYVFVSVRTHDGEVGVGEATLEWNEQSVVAAVAQMGRVIAGMNANRIEHIWQTLYRGGFWRGGPVLMSAIAGIEQALWDLKGKRLGAPVYELLGGACRDHIPLYGNGPRGSSPDEFARSAHAIVERGFRALKFAAVDATLAVDTSHTIERAAAIVGAVREAVGPDIAIAVDVHGRLSPAMSLRLADAIEPFDIWFLEEPALPGDPQGLANVRQGTRIPVAAGERLFERGEFRDLFERRAIALVQPDIAHCGGIAEARRIAAMAETYQIGFAPHNPLGPVNTIASAHVAMSTPNFVSLELLVDDVPWRDAMLREPLRIEGGSLFLSDAPGLGIELDLATCRAHPPTASKYPSFRQADGAVAEW
jgi:galactonate dehydratase